MNPETGVNLRWPVLATAAALLMAAGAGATYFALRSASRAEREPAGMATAAPRGTSSSMSRDGATFRRAAAGCHRLA